MVNRFSEESLDAYMLLLIKFLQIDQSTYDLLGKLMDKYKLGLVTNFAYCPGAHQILDRFKLRPYFKVIVISGEVGLKKPSKKIFGITLSKLSTSAEKAVFVGNDYEADIKGAVNAGMKSV